MTTNYPGGLDSFTNPTPANNLSDPLVLHSDEHANANDAIAALERWVGASGSNNTATIEYRLNHVAGGGGGGGGIMGWAAGVPLATGTVLNVIGAAFTISGTVLNLTVTGSSPVGFAGGDLTGSYPNPQVMWGNGTGFYGTVFAPLIHASRHEAGGADPIPLDLLAAPSDNTLLNATTGTHGLMAKLSGDPTHYIGGDGLEHNLPGVTNFYMTDSVSTITGTFRRMVTTYPSGTEANMQVSAILGTGSVFPLTFVTSSGTMMSFLSSQEVRVYANAAIVAGTKGASVYAKLFKYTLPGTEVLLGTTDNIPVTAVESQIVLGASVPDTVFANGDRLELKFYAIPIGVGTDPTVAVYYDGLTSSRVEAGVNPASTVTNTYNFYNNPLGIMGQNGGIPLGTGTTLNVNGSRLNMSLSGTVLNLTNSPDPQELIGVYGLVAGVPLGTGTSINWRGPNITVSLSGTVFDVFVTGTVGGGGGGGAGVDQIGVFGRNNGVNLGTGTTIDWGIGMNAAITGTTLFVHPFDGGTNGQAWLRITGSVQGAGWVNQDYNIQWFLGNGVNIVGTGSLTVTTPYMDTPVDSQVISWSVVADATGSFVANVLKSTYAAFPPTSPLTGLGQITLTNQRKNTANASGTATILKTDQLLLSIDSASSVRNVTVSLQCRKIATL